VNPKIGDCEIPMQQQQFEWEESAEEYLIILYNSIKHQNIRIDGKDPLGGKRELFLILQQKKSAYKQSL